MEVRRKRMRKCTGTDRGRDGKKMEINGDEKEQKRNGEQIEGIQYPKGMETEKKRNRNKRNRIRKITEPELNRNWKGTERKPIKSDSERATERSKREHKTEYTYKRGPKTNRKQNKNNPETVPKMNLTET